MIIQDYPEEVQTIIGLLFFLLAAVGISYILEIGFSWITRIVKRLGDKDDS